MELKSRIDGLIAIAVAIGWAVVKALMSREKDAGSWGEADQSTAPPPPHVPHRNQGEAPPMIPKPGPYANPIPPPIFTKLPPRPAAPSNPAPSTPPRPAPVPAPITLEQEASRMAPMNESRTAYQRGRSIQERVEKFMAAVDRETAFAKPATVARPSPSKAAHDILEMFRRPETTRQAFLASFVLNPPKALE